MLKLNKLEKQTIVPAADPYDLCEQLCAYVFIFISYFCRPTHTFHRESELKTFLSPSSCTPLLGEFAGIPLGESAGRPPIPLGLNSGFCRKYFRCIFHFIKSDNPKFHQSIENGHLVFSVNQRKRVTESGCSKTFVCNAAITHFTLSSR